MNSRLKWCASILSLVVMFVFSGIGNATATTVVSLDLQELVGSANEIVIARVISQRFIRSDHGKPLTEYTLQVHEGYKGSCKRGEMVTIIQPGGVIDGIGMHVAGTAQLQVGERYVLFARSTAPTDRMGLILNPVGMSQGAMKIQKDKHGRTVVLPSTPINTLKEDGRGGYEHKSRAILSPVQLSVLLNRVQTLIASQRAPKL